MIDPVEIIARPLSASALVRDRDAEAVAKLALAALNAAGLVIVRKSDLTLLGDWMDKPINRPEIARGAMIAASPPHD